MAKQTKIINMSLPMPLWEEVDRFARKEEISRSGVLKDSLGQYIKAKKRWEMIRKWGKEAGRKLEIKTEADIGKIIHEFREEEQRVSK